MAALSVDSAIGGTKTGRPRRAPRASASARSRLLADTPPAIPTLLRARASAPLRTSARAARRRRRAESSRRCRRRPRVRKRASSGAAGRRVRSCTSRSTAVLRPEKLKSVRRATAAGSRSAAGRARRVPIGVGQPRHRKAEAIRPDPASRADRSPARPDSRAPATSPPCRTPPQPRRLASGRPAGRRRASGTRYRLVWPPETTSTAAGSGSSPCASVSDSMWPAR